MLSLQSATQTHSDHILTYIDFISPALRRFKVCRGKNTFKAKHNERKTEMQTDRKSLSLSLSLSISLCFPLRPTHTHTLTQMHTHTVGQVKVLIRGAVTRSGQVCCIFKQISEDHGIKD